MFAFGKNNSLRRNKIVQEYWKKVSGLSCRDIIVLRWNKGDKLIEDSDDKLNI